jgi:hypothetical protein
MVLRGAVHQQPTINPLAGDDELEHVSASSKSQIITLQQKPVATNLFKDIVACMEGTLLCCPPTSLYASHIDHRTNLDIPYNHHQLQRENISGFSENVDNQRLASLFTVKRYLSPTGNILCSMRLKLGLRREPFQYHIMKFPNKFWNTLLVQRRKLLVPYQKAQKG